MKKYDYLCVIDYETVIVDPDSQIRYRLVNENYLKITELMQKRKLVTTQIEIINYGRVNNYYEIDNKDYDVYSVSGIIAEINQKHKSEDMPDKVDCVSYTKDCLNTVEYNCALNRFSIIETKEKRFVDITNNLRKYFEGDSI